MALKRKYERVSDTVQRRNRPFATYVTPAENKAYAAAVQAKRDTFTRQAFYQNRNIMGPAPKPEKKGVDTFIQYNPIIGTTSTNAQITILNGIQQGAGSWNRVGRKVSLKSVRVKGYYLFNIVPTAVTGNLEIPFVRYCIIWDRQPNSGTLPSYDAIFMSTAQTGTEATNTISDQVRYDNMSRFRILKDVSLPCPTVPIMPSGSAPASQFAIPVDEYLKINNLETTYSGSNNPVTIADIATGALYFVARALGATTSSVVCNLTSRVRYND